MHEEIKPSQTQGHRHTHTVLSGQNSISFVLVSLVYRIEDCWVPLATAGAVLRHRMLECARERLVR
jgi:hypothetical protein